ncbi:MAG: histidinol-phosphatase HisJ family protein [Ruminococcus sp.]|nr:histidinol-phosphatase HisJ family protein [Ruminococcus sp.]
MYADCHVHSAFSGDSDTPLRQQLDRAVSLGMEQICITDHNDFDVISDIDFNLAYEGYFAGLFRLREEYSPKIKVLCGVEQGLQEHLGEYLAKTAQNYPFDFIIGSVHFIDGLDPYYPEYFDKQGKNAYSRYFEQTLSCVKAINSFDSLGHLDYITRYGGDRGLSYSYGEYADVIDEILRAVIEKGKALECNTSPFARGKSEPNPCGDIFKRYRELGGELVTIGSDAHSPKMLACGFEQAGELLKGCGFGYYAVYRERKPVMMRL